ncbi:HAAS signaling domain-containing protein [Microbacterium soli]
MMTAVSDYLARLDVALRDVPHGVAAEIRAGIAEELSSLDAEAAEARIAQLGDPGVIAREAMDAGAYAASMAPPPAASAPPSSAGRGPASRTRGFAIVAALVLSFGGYIVPLVGWFVGVALVLMSTMWRAWEKTVAILAPVVFFAILLLFSLPASVTVSSGEVHEVSGDGAAEVATPLIPTAYDFSWSSLVLLLVLVIPASGLWLLWRMRGRTAS